MSVRDECFNTGRQLVPKGWGHEEIIVNREYCGKKMVLARGKKCSWHYHLEKDETFYVVSGVVCLRYITRQEVEDVMRRGWEEKEVLQSESAYSEVFLGPGDSFRISPGMLHQFEGRTDAVFMEFSTHDRPEDSIRIIKGD